MALQYTSVTKNSFFFLFLLCLIFPACDLQTTDVEYALKEAGENRGELEAVLSHYANWMIGRNRKLPNT